METDYRVGKDFPESNSLNSGYDASQTSITTDKPYKKFIINVEDDVQEPPFIFNIGGVGFSPIGNIMAIKAKAKMGKTQLTKIFVASAISGKYMGIECTMKNARVLYVDTEMGKPMTTLTMQSALAMCSKVDPIYQYNKQNKRLLPISLRTETKDKRWGDICDAVDDFNPNILIIDGIRDLIYDPNDVKESDDIITNILSLSEEKNIAIWNILHENKNDNNMRGHEGTELLNKSFEVLEVKKDNYDGQDIFKVEQTDCRWKPIGKFNFMLDEFGSPVPVQMGYASLSKLEQQMKDAVDDLQERHATELGEDGRPKVSLKRPDLIDSIQKTANVKHARANELLKKAEEQGIIYYDKTNKFVQLHIG